MKNPEDDFLLPKSIAKMKNTFLLTDSKHCKKYSFHISQLHIKYKWRPLMRLFLVYPLFFLLFVPGHIATGTVDFSAVARGTVAPGRHED